MRKLMFANLNENVKSVFGTEEKFNGFRSLSFDLATKVQIFDEEGKAINKSVAEKVHLTYIRNLLGIDENSTKRDRKRAFRKHKDEFFEVTEEVIDFIVNKGFKENEFFNTFVEEANIARGDRNEFWTAEEVYLSVVEVADDHHDYTLQRLGRGSAFSVPMHTYGIAVGADIDLYLAGRLDWSKFTEKCGQAFVRKIQNELYAEVMKLGASLPAQFKGTGTLGSSTKADFDQLIEDVETANESQVMIVGTKTALKNITALADVNWITDGQKEDRANTGRLGMYEGTILMEIPQRFTLDADFTLTGSAAAANRLVDSGKLLILPMVENKFVKFVDGGETEIFEVTEIGARMDDTMKYEMRRTMGISTHIGRYSGVWTF